MAISDLAGSMREDLEHEGPRVAKLLTHKTTLHFYLLDHTHAVLDRLLEAAIRLGALFHMAFDGGLLQLPAHGDGSGAPRSARR
ncbi:hypothetical protein ACIHFD_34855 [Nonomuraea sp. NPDC051941]|uniref:hypothetical protein n=1 Tax=Nonomuraea sp. NPDC051941 TaxID=3364373 RepID=UPI0037C6202B